MKVLEDKEFKELIQSGHINFLIGSGCSSQYINTLGDIEKKMNAPETELEAKKEYYQLIEKSKAILDEERETDLARKVRLSSAQKVYDDFLLVWAEILAKRKLHIVNKQINIFNTNFDMFIEKSCESLGIPYNDGFSGQIKRIFDVANFNKIYKYKTLQFDNISDIPLFNIIKLHGSISWKVDDNNIVYSDGSHIPDALDTKTTAEFEEGYEKIALINPNAEKHFETVLNVNYASMLRKFALELEKENSVLLVFGCSLGDTHISKLLYSALLSNPTLTVIYFSNSDPIVKAQILKEANHTNLYVKQLKFEESGSRFKDIFFPKEDNKSDA